MNYRHKNDNCNYIVNKFNGVVNVNITIVMKMIEKCL